LKEKEFLLVVARLQGMTIFRPISLPCRAGGIMPGRLPPHQTAPILFNQGINMYYAFHMIESIASFEKATRFDSTNAMAWYGRALSLGPTINDDATIRRL